MTTIVDKPGSVSEPNQCSEQAAASALFSLLDECEKLGVRVWVHGGWAIDAYTATIRPHEDIDLIAHKKDRAKLLDHFQTSVIENTPSKLAFLYGSTPVEITFFRNTIKGDLITVHPRLLVRWSPQAFGENRATLLGRQIPVVSLGVLYVEVANRILKKQEMLKKNAQDLARLEPLIDDMTRKHAEKYFPLRKTFWNQLRWRLGLL